ncbi:MAG: hypothetical protein ACRDP3_09685 [Streptomyces sp.]|uniref:hypothetical protein n=1 Tax=Streptomyces sp. TaxID=1931 RepID=UPI003D6A7E29
MSDKFKDKAEQMKREAAKKRKGGPQQEEKSGKDMPGKDTGGKDMPGRAKDEAEKRTRKDR